MHARKFEQQKKDLENQTPQIINTPDGQSQALVCMGKTKWLDSTGRTWAKVFEKSSS